MDQFCLSSEENVQWYSRMVELFENTLSEKEKQDLERWEKKNLDSETVATSDWPGWKKYIGPPPCKWRSN